MQLNIEDKKREREIATAIALCIDAINRADAHRCADVSRNWVLSCYCSRQLTMRDALAFAHFMTTMLESGGGINDAEALLDGAHMLLDSLGREMTVRLMHEIVGCIEGSITGGHE